MPINVDLIYVSESGERSMSCAVYGDKEALLGPVPSEGAIKALAPLLVQTIPNEFPDVKVAERHLMVIHFRNMSAGQNASGQGYPYEVFA